MAETSTTTFMNLVLPTPGERLGPTWATDINTALTRIDQHDHSSIGKSLGVAALTIDADVDFEPECPLRMLIAQRDIILTPYRIKTNDPAVVKYTTTVRDPKDVTVLPGGIIEILQGPAGMMMIHRRVFEKMMKIKPELEIKVHQHKDLFDKNLKTFSFWDCTFKNGQWTGDDIAFCNLAIECGFKLHANIESTMIHHGSYGYKGRYGDGLRGQNEVE